MELFTRTYTISTEAGNEFDSVKLEEDAQSFDILFRHPNADETNVVRVTDDEKEIQSVTLVSELCIVAVVRCETSESPHVELSFHQLPKIIDSEEEEEEELTQDEVQEAVRQAYVKHKQDCDQYNGGGPMMCFTQTKHDAIQNAKRNK